MFFCLRPRLARPTFPHPRGRARGARLNQHLCSAGNWPASSEGHATMRSRFPRNALGGRGPSEKRGTRETAHAHAHARGHTHTQRTDTRTRTRAHTHTRTHKRTHAHPHIHTRARTHPRAGARTPHHAQTHTHTHTPIRNHRPGRPRQHSMCARLLLRMASAKKVGLRDEAPITVRGFCVSVGRNRRGKTRSAPNVAHPTLLRSVWRPENT